MKKRRVHKTMSTNNEEILELSVGEPAHGGACVARDAEGRVVFVRHTLPGERVRVRVTSARSRLAWADAIDVLEASAQRQESVWPQAGPGGVGGGELAHVIPSAQRAWKQKVIEGQLRRLGGPELFEAIEGIDGVRVQPAPGDGSGALLHRRARIEAVVDQYGRLGMHRYRADDIVPLDSMPLAAEAIEELGVWGETTAWSDLFTPGDRVRMVAPGGQSAVLVTARAAFNSLGEQLQTRKLQWTVNVWGSEYVYAVRPKGFWQTHINGATVLANAVMRAAQLCEGERVIELYAGAGLFSVPIAEAIGPKGRLVTLEGDEGAVQDAGENLEAYGWVDAYVGHVDPTHVSDLSDELEDSADLVLLDPPRSGAGREVCASIGRLGAQRIVLVSCDPAAGARDLRDLVAAGYEVRSFEAWDLFPHTHHVETVAGLLRVR